MLQWQMANGNGKWNTPNGNGNATSIVCMHAYRKCKRLLSQARLRLRLRLRLSQTGAGPANDDTMADGSDKLKLFFARFSPPLPRQSKCTYRPTTFFSLETLGFVFCKKRFDLITANVRVLLLFVFVYTHTHSYTLLCVACRCIFQIFLCTVAHYALLCCQQMFSAFSHFHILHFGCSGKLCIVFRILAKFATEYTNFAVVIVVTSVETMQKIFLMGREAIVLSKLQHCINSLLFQYHLIIFYIMLEKLN